MPVKPAMRLLSIGLLCLLSAPLPADWVSLRDGSHLRGIDLKKHGDGFRFTLESGEVVYLAADSVFYHEKSPPDQKVEFRGEQVTLREKVRALQKERRKRVRQNLRTVETWARGKKGADEAREAFGKLPEKERLNALSLALSSSKVSAARRLAARELRRFRAPGVTRALALTAIQDRYRSVRDACLMSLREIKAPETPELFLPALRSKQPLFRTNAANALSLFPSRKAVPEMIETLYLAWTGFGQAYTMQTTQRAYVADYELVSGGTGFSIIEVADPIVRTNVTGVALDVKVRRVELRARLRALQKATGQNFGADVDRWRQWWKLQEAAGGE